MVFFHFGAKAKKNFIQEANRRSRLKGTTGTFGKWCKSQGLASDGKVTKACINKGLRSKNTTIIRRANFARNIGAYKGAVHRRRSRFGSYSSEETDYKNTKQLLEDYKHMLRTDQIPQEAVLDFYEDNIEPLERKLANHTFPRTYANAIISRRESSELASVIADYRRKNKLRFGKSKSRRKTKSKTKRSPTGQRKKYTPGGGRKSPGVSANSFPIGTVRTGLDGNNWVIKVVSNGTKRWVKMTSFGKRKRTFRFGYKEENQEEYKTLLKLNKDLDYGSSVFDKLPDNDPKKQKAETLIQKIKRNIRKVFTIRNVARAGRMILSILSWLSELIVLIASVQQGYAGLYAASSVFKSVAKPLETLFSKLKKDQTNIKKEQENNMFNKEDGWKKYHDYDTNNDMWYNKEDNVVWKWDEERGTYVNKGDVFNFYRRNYGY